MGTPGVKLNISKEAIVTALKESKGVISHACKRLDIAPYTLRKKLKEFPDVQELLSDLRHDYENAILDLAENCIAVTITKMQEDPSNALKASMFTLNSKGKERNWNNSFINHNNSVSQYELENKEMEIQALKAKINELQGQRETGQELPRSNTQV